MFIYCTNTHYIMFARLNKHSSLRIRIIGRSALGHICLDVRDNKALRSWGLLNYSFYQHTDLPLFSRLWKFPMALQEVTITHLYDIWHPQTVSTDTALPFCGPSGVKTLRLLSSAALSALRYCDNVCDTNGEPSVCKQAWLEAKWVFF